LFFSSPQGFMIYMTDHPNNMSDESDLEGGE
jgi:hypothetical protein